MLQRRVEARIRCLRPNPTTGLNVCIAIASTLRQETAKGRLSRGVDPSGPKFISCDNLVTFLPARSSMSMEATASSSAPAGRLDCQHGIAGRPPGRGCAVGLRRHQGCGNQPNPVGCTLLGRQEDPRQRARFCSWRADAEYAVVQTLMWTAGTSSAEQKTEVLMRNDATRLLKVGVLAVARLPPRISKVPPKPTMRSFMRSATLPRI